MKKESDEKMVTYVIRDIPAAVWLSFKVNCAKDEIPMRGKILEMIEKYNGERK